MKQDEKLMHTFPALRGKELLLEDMDLPVSIYNSLKRRKIDTLAQLLELTARELPSCFFNRKAASCAVLLEQLGRMAANEIG